MAQPRRTIAIHLPGTSECVMVDIMPDGRTVVQGAHLLTPLVKAAAEDLARGSAG